MEKTSFVTDRAIYERVILEAIPECTTFLWLATADLKDLYVNKGKKMVPFLEIVSDLIEKGVSVRLLHAKEPGVAFRQDFDRYPALLEGLERICCPRVHFKSVIIDGRCAYSGSANLTGAGIGAKSEHRRNFESGILTTDPTLIRPVMDQFDGVWMGSHCGSCGRKSYCSDYMELL